MADENVFEGIGNAASGGGWTRAHAAPPITIESLIEGMKQLDEHFSQQRYEPPIRIVSKSEYDDIVENYEGSWELWMAAQYKRLREDDHA